MMRWLVLAVCTVSGQDLLLPNVAEYDSVLNQDDFGRAADGQVRRVDEDVLFTGSKRRLEEGDIKLSEGVNSIDDLNVIIPKPGVEYSAVRSKYSLWPEAKIPYSLSSRYSRFSRSTIAAAMDEFSRRTCIEFVPRQAELDYMHIMPDDGCYSEVGRSGGRQLLSLDVGCIDKGVIMHELMHIAGFFHEQSRNDRDAYIRVKYENVLPGLNGQFRKYSLNQIDHLGIEYDYDSIMHYGPKAFTKNGKDTIETRKPNQNIGQRRGFSRSDVLKVNKLYSCASDGTSGVLTTITEEDNREEQRPDGSECRDEGILCRFIPGIGLCSLIAKLRETCCATCS